MGTTTQKNEKAQSANAPPMVQYSIFNIGRVPPTIREPEDKIQ